MIDSLQRLKPGGILAAGLLAVATFGVLAGRFWHPFYGFTKFVQLDEYDARVGIHEVRENPVYVYAGENGYDGAAYAQIAFHPLLDSPELSNAIGNVPYRARRILGSALAWLLAGGNPFHIASYYAGLNLVVWLALAALLWRVLRVNDVRSLLAWFGVMFSAGALHSVRLALTDLLAATLAAAALVWSETGRNKTGLVTMACAGLARETTLANIVALWRGPWRSPRSWGRNVGVALLATLPLMAWVGYVRWKAGPAAQGFGNFSLPVAGWLEKWSATIGDYAREPDFRWLITTTLLAVAGLTVQAVFFLRHRRWEDPWWRAGLTGVAMMALFGTSVWEGHPGAATRVLLPMGIAFAVVAVRTRAHLAWIAGGSLTVFSGVLALWHVPQQIDELATGRFDGGSYVAQLGPGWFGVEHAGRARWAWAGERGELRLTIAASDSARPWRVRVKLRAMAPREIIIAAGGHVVWQGTATERAMWVTLAPLPDATTATLRNIALEITSTAPPMRESADSGARSLGFAVYGVELE